jgi:hypothetical protein
MTDRSEAERVAKGWLAASFQDPTRKWSDVPLCIRTRSTILQENTDAQ